MSATVSVQLSENTLRRAGILAKAFDRNLADVIAGTLELAFQPIDLLDAPEDFTQASDTEVLHWIDGRMPEPAQSRLSALLEMQGEQHLNAAQAAELAGLLELEQVGTFYKAQAWGEAIRRGLRPPPNR